MGSGWGAAAAAEAGARHAAFIWPRQRLHDSCQARVFSAARGGGQPRRPAAKPSPAAHLALELLEVLERVLRPPRRACQLVYSRSRLLAVPSTASVGRRCTAPRFGFWVRVTVCGLPGARRQDQLVHRQPAALRGGPDKTLVERHVRAQRRISSSRSAGHLQSRLASRLIWSERAPGGDLCSAPDPRPGGGRVQFPASGARHRGPPPGRTGWRPRTCRTA